MELNLLNLLTFYLLVMFAASTWRRWQQYRELAGLVLGSQRWPNLLKLIKQHRMIFLTWRTVAPLVLTLGLMVVQILASQVLLPEAASSDAGISLNTLTHESTPLSIIVISLGIGMVAVDVYFLIRVGRIDRLLVEQHLDQAEYWLKSRMAHVVKFVTFGWVNPRRMVADEVQKALVDASNVINSTLWWVNLQMALRFSFALSLWIGWAMRK
jgi:hypothetical protein